MSRDAPTIDYKALLEDERAQLLSQLSEMGFIDGTGLSYDHNFADSSQVTAERGEAEALASPLRDALSDVEWALKKLDAGTFGKCERCENEINATRLEAMPATRYCIACATAR